MSSIDWPCSTCGAPPGALCMLTNTPRLAHLERFDRNAGRFFHRSRGEQIATVRLASAMPKGVVAVREVLGDDWGEVCEAASMVWHAERVLGFVSVLELLDDSPARRVREAGEKIWRALIAKPIPCGHTIGDLVGGAGAVTKCGACVAERRK